MKTTALDTETFLIFSGYMAPELVCVSWARDEGSGVLHHGDPGVFDFVKESLEGRTVWANAPFDLAVLLHKWPQLYPVIFKALEEGRVHDVQTREKLLDLARGTFRFEEDEDGRVKAKGYSLAEITQRRLGRSLEKDTWRMKYHDLWDVPIKEWPEGALDYADADAVAPLEIFHAQEKLEELLKNEAAQVRGHFALHLSSCWGFMTSEEAVDRLETWVSEEVQELLPEIQAAGLVRPDGTRDTKAAVRRMLEAMGEEAILTTKGLDYIQKMEKTRDQVLEEARRSGKLVSVSRESTLLSGDTVLMKYSRYTQLRNILTGSVKQFRRGTRVPIQTRYQPIMETGRTSSAGPNIQNLRRAPGIRECFVARPGHVLIAADYPAAELHTLAQVCFDLFGFSKLGDALNSGVDVHLHVGAQLLGISYADAEEALRDSDHELHGQVSEARQVAKAANFGFPGGCSAARFVGIAHGYGVDLEVREAARIRAMWFRAWSEMRGYFDHVSSCTDRDGWHYVEQLRADRLRSRCTFTSACNSYFQGLAADGAKAALWAVTKAQHLDHSSPLFGTKILAFVHDEVLIEVPETSITGPAMELSRIMAEEFNSFVPDCPVQGVEVAAMRYWSKKARPVWEDGELIPWAA